MYPFGLIVFPPFRDNPVDQILPKFKAQVVAPRAATAFAGFESISIVVGKLLVVSVLVLRSLGRRGGREGEF